MSNSLDPDQAQHFVGTDLDPSCLQKFSAEDISRQRVNYVIFSYIYLHVCFLCFSELRLKKKHKPFYMVQQWDELCSKYTDAKAEDISNGQCSVKITCSLFLYSIGYF